MRERQPRDLLRLRGKLDAWRTSNARGAAFPGALWSAAGRVARRHGVYVTARALGLEYNKLKRMSGAVGSRASGQRAARSVPKPVTFIDVTGVLPGSAGGCRLSLQGPEGQRLQVEMGPGAATEMVLQLCRSGWSASL
jgi:hypothetical protein